MSARKPRRNPLAINTREWRRTVARVVREEPVCRLRLPGCTIKSTTADHIVPRKHAPHLTWQRSNLRGACRSCNLRKGSTPDHRLEPLRRRQQRARALRIFE